MADHDPPVRYGVIGTGMMGCEHLQNLAHVPGAVVTAVADPHPTSREWARRAAPHAAEFTDHRDLLDSGLVDAVVVASPNMTHAAVLDDVLAAGVHVLAEKPLCTTVADCERIVAAATGHPGVVWMGLEYRYLPPVARLVAEVRAGTAGRVHMVAIREHRFPFLHKVGNWNRFSRNTGGTLVEKCCHFFDLMRLLARSRPVRVYATAGAPHNHQDERHPDGVPDILDHAYAVVDFESGPRALLELCMFAEGSRYQEEISIVGPKGKVECFVPGPGRFWPAHLGAPPVPKLVLSPRQPAGPVELEVPVDAAALAAGDHNGSTLEQHRRFRLAVLGMGPVDVTLDDGLAAVVMGLAAQESTRTGQAVDLRLGAYAIG
jgi:predicted dehydrogenase